MKSEVIKITEQEKEMFDYLNDLRRNGSTNMFGATPHLVEGFNIGKNEARNVVSKWMKNFNKDGYEDLL